MGNVVPRQRDIITLFYLLARTQRLEDPVTVSGIGCTVERNHHARDIMATITRVCDPTYEVRPARLYESKHNW